MNTRLSVVWVPPLSSCQYCTHHFTSQQYVTCVVLKNPHYCAHLSAFAWRFWIPEMYSPLSTHFSDNAFLTPYFTSPLTTALFALLLSLVYIYYIMGHTINKCIYFSYWRRCQRAYLLPPLNMEYTGTLICKPWPRTQTLLNLSSSQLVIIHSWSPKYSPHRFYPLSLFQSKFYLLFKNSQNLSSSVKHSLTKQTSEFPSVGILSLYCHYSTAQQLWAQTMKANFLALNLSFIP